jgi:hypothetical protein
MAATTPPYARSGNLPRRAVRRGAARPAEGPSRWSGRLVGSRPLTGASPPSRHGCRAPQAPSTGHGSTSSGRWGDRGGPDVRMLAAPWSPCPPPRSASTRPLSAVRCPLSGGRCPVSGVRCERTVSVPAMSTPTGVQCPGVDVRRPASVSARPAPAVSAPGDFVERVVPRAAAHSQEGPGSGRPAVSRTARPSA